MTLIISDIYESGGQVLFHHLRYTYYCSNKPGVPFHKHGSYTDTPRQNKILSQGVAIVWTIGLLQNLLTDISLVSSYPKKYALSVVKNTEYDLACAVVGRLSIFDAFPRRWTGDKLYRMWYLKAVYRWPALITLTIDFRSQSYCMHCFPNGPEHHAPIPRPLEVQHI